MRYQLIMDQKWKLSSISSMSVDSGKESNRNRKFQLHLIQKKEAIPLRPVIPTTKLQRLSYFRAYTASIYKTELLPTGNQQIKINWFLWLYCFNTFFKSLPHTFVHIFLASYSPQNHLFVNKMVPIAYGTKYLCLMTTILELLLQVDTIILILYYFLVGTFYKNPWNRCDNISLFDRKKNITIFCYNITEFTKKFAENTVEYSSYAYITDKNETFLMAQIDYYRKYGLKNVDHYFRDIIYFLFVWVILAVFEYQVVTVKFWKVFHLTQWAANSIDIILFLYLLWSTTYIDQQPIQGAIPQDKGELEITSELWKADINMVGESITAPPVVHILTARSTQPINPSRDSSLIIISNGLMYILRGIVMFMARDFCKRLIRTEVFLTDLDQNSYFYFWPIFFSIFYLGNIYSIAFFGIGFFMELLTAMVTCRCLSEIVLNEFKVKRVVIKKWMFTLCFILVGIIIFAYTSFETRLILYIYGKSIATLVEILLVYLVYPLGRMIDDYSFHYGVPPTRLRILFLRLVPLYYSVKFYYMIVTVINALSTKGNTVDLPHYQWSWSLFILTIVIGAIYMAVNYSIRFKMVVRHLFTPMPDWGPADYTIRQLRKIYDSRYYIRSEVQKPLSQYFMMTKNDSQVFKLDVRYDFYRRSTVKCVDVKFREERLL